VSAGGPPCARAERAATGRACFAGARELRRAIAARAGIDTAFVARTLVRSDGARGVVVER
jgi:hypothetical protein